MVPDGGEDGRLRLLDKLRGSSPRLCHRRDPDVDRVRARIRGHGRILGPEQPFSQPRGHDRLADPGQAIGPGDPLLAQSTLVEAGEHPISPHRADLGRRTRQRNHHAAVGPIHPPPRSGAAFVGDRRRRRNQPRLLEIRLGEREASSLEEGAQPARQLGIHGRALLENLGDRLTGKVVRRGAQAAGRHDQIGGGQGLADGGRDRGQSVGKCRDPQHFDAGVG